jgi:hypothetical protein
MIRRSALFVWLTCFLATAAGADTKSWTGAVNNLWSVGGNWSGGVAPVDGDSLLFPNGSANRNTVNDLTGLDLGSISIAPASFPSYSATGNAITLSGGLITTACCSIQQIVWSVPVTLTASQTFGGAAGGVLDLAGPITLNGHTLTIDPYDTTLSGSITGTGAVTVLADTLHLSGTSSFTGTFTITAGSNLIVTGTISNSTLTGTGTISGTGTLPTTGVIGTTIRPGTGGGVNTTAILTTGSFAMTGGTLAIDINGTTPGTNYDQLAVNGTVNLDSPTLQVNFPGAPPTAGQTFVIIANDGADPVTGTFSGLPQGAIITAGGVALRISYTGGDGNDVVLTALAATATALTSSPNPVVTGAPFTLTATVTSSFGTPTGTVRFVEGATVLGTATLNGSGVATLTVQTLPPGSHTIVAEYLGAGTFAPSTSAPLAQLVLARVSIADATANGQSANTTVNVIVSLSAPSNQTVRVDYATADGTAIAGSDYVATSGTLEFAPGVTSQAIVITILGDTADETPETFRVVLSNPQNAVLDRAEAVVTIVDVAAIPAAGTLGLLLVALGIAAAGVIAMRHA